jgi:hypothetical protein
LSGPAPKLAQHPQSGSTIRLRLAQFKILLLHELQFLIVFETAMSGSANASKGHLLASWHLACHALFSDGMTQQ